MEETGDKTQVFTGHVVLCKIFGEHAYEKYTLKDGDNFIGRDEETLQFTLDQRYLQSMRI